MLTVNPSNFNTGHFPTLNYGGRQIYTVEYW